MNETCRHFIGRDGVWRERIGARDLSRAPKLFLDRDGVVVDEVNYLHRLEDVRLINGAAQTIVGATRIGYYVVMVTNQGGIGRGFYGWREFSLVNACILARLEADGARFDAVLAAPQHPLGLGDYRASDHPMGKPSPGMLLEAARLLGGDVSTSIIVGDSSTDIAAGRRAGALRGVLVKTGHGRDSMADALKNASPDYPVDVVESVGDSQILGLLELAKSKGCSRI
jgi:D-glycero-D-manno-heptose 1,7-bisphosphate phosphatase